MCAPIAVGLIIAAVSAAGTAASVIQNNKAVQNQLNGTAVAQQADINAITAQMGEVDDGVTGASLAIQAEANRARATLRVAQGESGLVGPTQLREIAASRLAENANLATLEANRASQDAQISRNLDNINITAQGRINAAKDKAIGPAAAGLQIGGSAAGGFLSGYTAGKSIYPSKAPPLTTGGSASGWTDSGGAYPMMAGGTS